MLLVATILLASTIKTRGVRSNGIIGHVQHAVSSAQALARSELGLLADFAVDEETSLRSLLFATIDSALEKVAVTAEIFADGHFFLHSSSNITYADVNSDADAAIDRWVAQAPSLIVDSTWIDEVEEKAFSIERAGREAEEMVVTALMALDEMKNQSAIDYERVWNDTKHAIIAQTATTAPVEQSNPLAHHHLHILDAEGPLPPAFHRNVLRPESWKSAGYEILDEISPSLALQVITSLPLSTYRLRNDRKEAILVARGKSTDEMRTRSHIGPITTESVPHELVVNRSIDIFDPSILASLNLKATTALADAADILLDKVKTIDALLLSGETNSIAARIQAIKNMLDNQNKGSTGYTSIKQLAWEALALEAESSAKEIAVLSHRLKHSVRMKVLETKFMTKDRLLEGQTLSLSHIDSTQDALSSKRDLDLAGAESDLDCIIERVSSINSIAAMKNATKRGLELVSENADAETSMQRAQIIAEAKFERDQEQATLERISIAGEEKRKQAVEIIGAIFNYLYDGLSHIVYTNEGKRQCILLCLAAALLVFAISSARESISLVFSSIQRLLTTPSLVREYGRARWWWQRREESSEEIFHDVILSAPLKDRVVDLAKSARKAKRHDAPYRHILLYGPPGTGKTMVAKKLAQRTGLDYALMSGGDVGPLGAEAVTQVHTLFRWAKSSRKGLLLFVDEAEAFLGNRKHSKMSENSHNALNALLYNTGGERRDFMLVLATNRPEDLDAAVLDRCDEFICVPLPDADCRRKLISQYYTTFVKDKVRKNTRLAATLGAKAKSLSTNEGAPFRIQIEKGVMEGHQLERVVAATDGFSGREIGKLMVAILATLYSSDEGKLTKDMAQGLVDSKVRQHEAKQILM